MVGKTPAALALAALVGMAAGTGDSAAQTGSPEPGAAETTASSSAATEQPAGTAAAPETSSFDAWRDRFRARALKDGIPHDVFERALGSVTPNPEVHEKDADQPEFTRAIWDYLDGAVSDTRVRNGRKKMRAHASLLAKAEKAYGVPRRFLVAIWGMETSYGALLGSHNIFEALATLAYRGDRQQYGEEQLLAALRLLADGHKPLEAMKGSWAGAVGHTQFVPTTYLTYAVDGDNDGRRDLWDSLSDVFHSTAHYLKKSGFDPNLKWGREAFLPDDFDYGLAGYHVTKPLSEWRALGIRMANGNLVPDLDITASVLVPAGHQGPAFLIYENFEAILAYNRSTSYALAIGLLSDQINGGPSLKKSWPRHLKPIALDQRIELQKRLAALGYDPGSADGVLGRQTRKAIRAFQKDHGEIADGYATHELIAKLRAASPAGADRVSQADSDMPQEQPVAEETTVAQAPESGIRSPDAEGEEPAAAADSAGTGSQPAAEAAPVEPQPASDTGETAVARTADTPQSETQAPAETATEVAEARPAEAPALQEAEPQEAEPQETAQAEAAPESMPTPREKDSALGSTESTEIADAADTPTPRVKPVVASSGAAALPRTKPTEKNIAPATRPPHGGISAALAAPGLRILGNGVAAPYPPSRQAGAGTAAAAGTAEALPANNSEEAIVSPPGTVYVGAEAEAEQAANRPEAPEEETPEDEADEEAGEAAGEEPSEAPPPGRSGS